MAVADLLPELRAFLLADAATFTAVGGARIFPVVMPQGERRPSLVVTRISDTADYHMQGPSGLTAPRYQLDAYAETQDDAASLANLVKDRIDGFRGMMGAVAVRGVFIEAGFDTYEDGSKLYRVSRDFRIWFAER